MTAVEGTPLIIMLHPWGSTGSTTWSAVAAELTARGYRAAVIDLHGHGTAVHRAYSWEAAVQTVIDRLDAERARTMVLVGLSLGAAVAIHVAYAHPDRVAWLVLAGAAVSWHADRRVSRGLRVAGRVASLLGAAGIWLPLAYVHGYRGAQLISAARQLSAASPRELVRAADALASFDASDFDLTGVPVTVMVFTHDRRLPAGLQRALARHLRADTIDVDGDHDAPVREKYAVAQALELNMVIIAGPRGDSGVPELSMTRRHARRCRVSSC